MVFYYQDIRKKTADMKEGFPTISVQEVQL